jgi:flagellar motility protein MotE (MotC chaperone)
MSSSDFGVPQSSPLATPQGTPMTIYNRPGITFLSFILISTLLTQVYAADPQPEKPLAESILEKKDFNSVEERRLYTVLKNERDNLVDAKKALILKEKELKTLATEADKKLKLLDEKLKELQKLQDRITESLATKDAEEVRKTKELSLIYAKMSPDRAALAIAGLDEQLAADLLANMKIKSAAKILDRLDKVKASKLSRTFTTIKVE